MRKFKYTLNELGRPIAYGYEDYNSFLTGSEPFAGFEIVDYKMNLETKEWIFDPIIMIPQTISKLQAVSRLLEIEKYNDLMAALDSDQTGIKKILFDAAHELARDSTMVNEMALILGFTDNETDVFFTEAAKILV